MTFQETVNHMYGNTVTDYSGDPPQMSRRTVAEHRDIDTSAQAAQNYRDEMLAIIGPNADPYASNQPATYLEYLHGLQQAAAREQMQFQQASAREAMQFEATQAALNRDFQREMSNTAYQRAVSDLRKAGLNPVLAVGASASTPQGSSAQGFAQSGAKASFSEQNLAQETLKMYVNSAVDIVEAVGKIIAAAF